MPILKKIVGKILRTARSIYSDPDLTTVYLVGLIQVCRVHLGLVAPLSEGALLGVGLERVQGLG